jgi:putative transposase
MNRGAVVNLLQAIGRCTQTLADPFPETTPTVSVRRDSLLPANDCVAGGSTSTADRLASEGLSALLEAGWRTDQRWMTFVRNHAESVVACDFFTVVTAMFKVLYVFVVVEHAARRIVHCNVTEHLTADWTLQQLREAIPADHSYRFLIRDRDGKFSRPLDESIKRLCVHVLKTPVRAPKANAICERTIGTICRECLNYLIPLGEQHLRRILAEWIGHFNAARPHSALGLGIPSPPIGSPPVELRLSRHSMPAGARVTVRPILGSLHHEYALQQAA